MHIDSNSSALGQYRKNSGFTASSVPGGGKGDASRIVDDFLDFVEYVSDEKNSTQAAGRGKFSASYEQDLVKVEGLAIPGAKVPFYRGKPEDTLVVEHSQVYFDPEGSLKRLEAKINTPKGSWEEITFCSPQDGGEVQNLLFADFGNAHEGYLVQMKQSDGDLVQVLWNPSEDTLAVQQTRLKNQPGARKKDEFGDLSFLHQPAVSGSQGPNWALLGAMGATGAVILAGVVALLPGSPPPPVPGGPNQEQVQIGPLEPRSPVQIDQRFEVKGQPSSGTQLQGPGAEQFAAIQDSALLTSAGIFENDLAHLRQQTLEEAQGYTNSKTDKAELNRYLYVDNLAEKVERNYPRAEVTQQQSLEVLHDQAMDYLKVRSDYLKDR